MINAVKYYERHKSEPFVNMMQDFADQEAVQFAEWLSSKDEEFFEEHKSLSFSELKELKKVELKENI